MTPFLLQAISETRERSFEWGDLPAPWVVFLLVLPIVIGFVAYFYRRERPAAASRRSRWILGSLRVLTILTVLAILAKPMIRETVYQSRDPQVLVLVDDSLSMKIQDKYTDRAAPKEIGDMLGMSSENVEHTGRYDLVASLLRQKEGNFLDGLRRRGKVALWTFSGRAKKIAELSRLGSKGVEAEDAGPLLPEFEKVQSEESAKQTRIGDSLSEAVWGGRGLIGREAESSTSVVVFTDGQQNSGTLQPEELARRLGARGIPVYAIGVGNPEQPRDVRIVDFDPNPIALVGDRITFDAAVISEGFEGERVRVDLQIDGTVMDTQYVTLAGGGERQPVRLAWIPREPGKPTVSVRVEALPSELLEENNVASKTIQVLDQKIKVLYLEGPPRWEYNYLKNALIRDKTMEAQIFLYSADPTFIQESSEGVPSLKAFPASREELFKYHVVIIGDVDPDTDKLSTAEMDLLKDFVAEAGGGVVFIAGQNADPARYLHTPLEQLLPVEVPASGRVSDESRSPTERFNVKLTGVGKEHPVLRLDNDPEKNVELWENPTGSEGTWLPPFYWFAEVNREKKGAVKLAIHPSRGHPVYGPWVIFAFQNLGKGRTFFSAVDNTWRWRAGVDNYYFYRFWGQVIRFAAGGRIMAHTERLSITTDKLTYTIGDKINISCQVYDANMKPATDDTLKVYHSVDSGASSGARAPDVITLAINKVKGPGSYDGTVTAEQLGRHDFWLGSELERQETRSVVVEVPALEFRDIRMNRDLLRRMADASGGKYYDFSACRAIPAELGAIAKSHQTPIDDRLEDIWDTWWTILLLTGLLAAEWIYRKVVRLQ